MFDKIDISKSLREDLIATLESMFDKFDEYQYSEDGFEDTKEFNELKVHLKKLKE
jgi:hypothetical protein